MKISNISRTAAALFMGALIFSSCAKKEYYGFAPSPERSYVKAKAPIAPPASPEVVAPVLVAAPAVLATDYSAPAQAAVTAPVPAPKMAVEAPVSTTISNELRAQRIDAFKDYYKTLNRTEKKQLRKQVKQQMKAEQRGTDVVDSDVNIVLLVILAILLPPVAVGIVDGFGSTPFWIDLVLTLLFFLPGIIYALIRIF